MAEYDDDTLGRIMREGLEARAGLSGTRLAEPPGHVGGDPAVVRRRRGRLLVAAALVAGVAGVACVGGATAYLHRPGPDRVAVEGGPGVDTWRFESYAGVEVRVPPTWGWGGAPTQVGGETMSCGTTTGVAWPGGAAADTASRTPFVGRPTMMSDACLRGVGNQGWPRTDAVWLGSPLPVGTDASGPEVAQTIAVGAQRVTAFSDDDALRARILATAVTVEVDGNGCPTEPRTVPGVADPTPGSDSESLSVCAYRRGLLLWSTREDAQHAQDYVAAFSRASATYDAATACTTPPTDQWVAIAVNPGPGGGVTRWDIANLDCPALVGTSTDADGTHTVIEAPLTPETVAPWAGGGIRAYVAGPLGPGASDPALAPYFRGMLG